MYPHAKRKTTRAIGTKLVLHIGLLYGRASWHALILGQKVKGQGHSFMKCQAWVCMSVWLSRLLVGQPFVQNCIWKVCNGWKWPLPIYKATIHHRLSSSFVTACTSISYSFW